MLAPPPSFWVLPFIYFMMNVWSFLVPFFKQNIFICIQHKCLCWVFSMRYINKKICSICDSWQTVMFLATVQVKNTISWYTKKWQLISIIADSIHNKMYISHGPHTPFDIWDYEVSKTYMISIFSWFRVITFTGHPNLHICCLSVKMFTISWVVVPVFN